MSHVVTQIDGQVIARDVALRAKALNTLRSARRPHVVVAFAPFVAILLVGIALTGLHADFWPKTVIGLACMLSIASIATSWHFHRQLSAIADLLLLNESERR
jgi:hypothetical protein